MSKKEQTIPLKCQLCPYFEWYNDKKGYECAFLTCELKYNDELRKEIYKAIGKMYKGE